MFKRYVSIRILTLAFTVWTLIFSTLSYADNRFFQQPDNQVYTLGVLSYGDKESTFNRWQPLANYLSLSIRNAQFTLEVYFNEEMEAAVANEQIDFILTQPAQYVLLTYRHQLSSPLASLLNKENGQTVDKFGGIIFTRSDRDDIATVPQIKGKTIAAASLTGLGAFQMQAYELLQQGVRIPNDVTLLLTGQPQRNAIDAVLSGQADVGFIRTGVLESLVERNLIDINKLKLLNAQRFPNYPFATSTRLYPEWAFAALSHVNTDMVRSVASLLLAIQPDSQLADVTKTAGFTIAGDYRMVDSLMRELRLEPFDDFQLSVQDIFDTWLTEILMGIALVVLMICFFFILLLKNRIHLSNEQMHLKHALNQLRIFNHAIDQSPESIVITDTQGRMIYMNHSFKHMTGFSSEEMNGKNPRQLKSGQTSKAVYEDLWKHLNNGQVWRGVLYNKRKNGEIYPSQAIISPVKGESGLTTHYLSIQHDISNKLQQDQRIDALLYRDALTNLANRNKLIKVMSDALHRYDDVPVKGCLLMMNILRFKFINQIQGVDIGDTVLQIVGQRLAKSFEKMGVVARIVADQFAIFCVNSTQLHQTDDWLTMLGQRVLSTLNAPVEVKDEVFHLEVYVGIARMTNVPLDHPTEQHINHVFSHAELALKKARESTHQNLEIFNPQLLNSTIEKHQLRQALENGIKKGELRLFVQPQVNHESQTVGLECLVRWQHPDRGLLLPGCFIALAEESQLIVLLGKWVLQQGCRLLAKIQTIDQHFRVAVNISSRHFLQKDFIAQCTAFLSEAKALPHGLTLEITESLFLDNFDAVVESMIELKKLGIRISIDDFGTGYSSLSYLQHLPVDELKIDRAFILAMNHNGEKKSLVSSIYAMAQQMHLHTVAEGIETEQQREQLKRFKQLDMQGFLFAKPTDHQEWLTHWIESSNESI